MYSNSYTGLDRIGGFQEFEAPRFQDNRHMKAKIITQYTRGKTSFHGK